MSSVLGASHAVARFRTPCAPSLNKVAAVVLGLFAFAGSASAERLCRLTAGSTTLQLPELHLPSTPALGEPLGTFPYDLEITCTGAMNANAGTELQGLLLHRSDITQAGEYLLNGPTATIAYQLFERERGLLINSVAQRYHRLESRAATSSTVVYRFALDLRLFGTGRPPRPGQLDLSTIFRTEMSFPNAAGNNVSQPATSFDHAARGPVRTATCNLSSTPWVMDAVGAEALATGGASAGQKGFSIAIDCDSDANLSFTLTDANSAANRTTVLAADSSSSTTGVGFEVLRGGTPIQLGTVWQTTAPAGASALPFEARYTRTAGTLQPGEITSKATLTLTYR